MDHPHSLANTADGTDTTGDRRTENVAFTPGPWAFDRLGGATVSMYEVFDQRTATPIADFIDREANAHLIAAAPALYEAIKPLAFSSQWDPPVGVDKTDWGGAVLAARAALRLARGEKQ